MTRSPAAYLRRSEEGGITKEDEIAKLRDLAHREGHNGDVLWFDDWGHSADEAKGAQRELDRLIAEMKAGRIGTVYAGKMDRLARSVAVFARFAHAAREHDVRLVTVAEGDMSEATVDGDPFKWAARQFMVTMAEMELRTIKARVRRAQHVRQERGDVFGHAPYGFRHVRDEHGRIVREPDPAQPLEPLLAAYRDAGSVLGACRLLEARGIPAPKGGTRWATSALTRILEANAPDLLARPRRWKRHHAAEASPVARFARLLACPFCGRTLTPNQARGQYYCAAGPRDRVAHPRYAVREVDVLPWIRIEAARLEVPADTAEMAEGNAARQAVLAGKRERWAEQYAEGIIGKAKRDAELAKIDAELAELEARSVAAVAIPQAVPWEAPAEQVNAVLRALWHRVTLGPDMLPVAAEWIIPEWRRNG